MLARVLIVVLLALNLGVAVWWLLREAPAPYRVPAVEAGVAPLQVLRPQAEAVGPAMAAQDAADTRALPMQCLRIGPFPDLAAAQSAQVALALLVADPVLDEIPAEAAGYRVLLLPASDAAAAQAQAQRIADAGFEDYLVIPQGGEANAIALGSYRSRDSAMARMQALRRAGFPAVMRARGQAATSQWWLEAESGQADVVRARLEGVEIGDCQLLGAVDAAGTDAR